MLPPVMYGVLLCVCTADTKSHKRYTNKKYVQTYLGWLWFRGRNNSPQRKYIYKDTN